MKTCCTCKEAKPHSEFYAAREQPDGRQRRCKACDKAKALARHAARRSDAEYMAARRRRERARHVRLSDNPRYKAKRQQSYRAWAAANPELIRAYAQQRRAAKYAASTGERFTDSEVLSAYGTDCHLCGEAIDLVAPRSTKEYHPRALHIDHVAALVHGGKHSLANVRPSHAECNLRKGAS